MDTTKVKAAARTLLPAAICLLATGGATAEGGTPDHGKPGFWKRLMTRQTMPLPPELSDGARVIKVGPASTPKHPLHIPPYAVTRMRVRDAGSSELGVWVARLGYERVQVSEKFAFQLARKDAEAEPLFLGSCQWAVGTEQLTWTGEDSSVEARIREIRLLACLLTDEPGGEPWVLWLACDAHPRDLVSLEVAERGGLRRGDIYYEARTTFRAEPSGLTLLSPTGTVFTRDSLPVAAVERMPPGRILLAPTLEPDEERLLVAASAAILYFERSTLFE